MSTTENKNKGDEMKLNDCKVGMRVFAGGIFGTIVNIARGRITKGTCRVTVKLDQAIEEYGNKKTYEINCAPGYLNKAL